MKLLAILALLLLVGGVSALSLDFQNAVDFDSINCIGGTPCTSGGSTNGGNLYITVVTGNPTYVYNKVAIPLVYSAASSANGALVVSLLDSGGNILWNYNGAIHGTPAIGRTEMIMIGGQANFYTDGVFVIHSPVLAQNPSYVGWGGYIDTKSWDDIVWGTTDGKYVFGMPTQNSFIIMRDFTNPSASGFAWYNGTIINSNNMTTTWSKNNGVNESVFLANTDTGAVYATAYTGTAYTGSIAWDLNQLFNNNAPMGPYRTYSSNGTGYSNSIFYIGGGATINWDSHNYNQGDTAVINWQVSTGAYWDTALYSYQIKIQDIYGVEVTTVPVTTQSGTTSYTWLDTNNANVYYAIIQATDKSTGEVVWMNYDYTTLSAFLTLHGYVFDAQTTHPINGSVVNITQGALVSNVTATYGNYTVTGFYSGSTALLNVTATGYVQYRASILPQTARTQWLNFSLVPNSPTVVGRAIAGVARTGTRGADNLTITMGYGEPIAFPLVYVQNVANGQHFFTTGNSVGGYACDESSSCFLVAARSYDLWGQKTGFSNSPNYTVVA